VVIERRSPPQAGQRVLFVGRPQRAQALSLI
jgi:hypothetical protein